MLNQTRTKPKNAFTVWESLLWLRILVAPQDAWLRMRDSGYTIWCGVRVRIYRFCCFRTAICAGLFFSQRSSAAHLVHPSPVTGVWFPVTGKGWTVTGEGWFVRFILVLSGGVFVPYVCNDGAYDNTFSHRSCVMAEHMFWRMFITPLCRSWSRKCGPSPAMLPNAQTHCSQSSDRSAKREFSIP